MKRTLTITVSCDGQTPGPQDVKYDPDIPRLVERAVLLNEIHRCFAREMVNANNEFGIEETKAAFTDALKRSSTPKEGATA